MSSEAVVQQQVRLALARMGALMYRNNSGAFTDENGRHVRFGLGNDSAQLNAQIKSADLIGLVPITITPDMVGKTIGVFTAIECKRPGWRMTPGDKRACAQDKFLTLVRNNGGFGGFVTDPQDLNMVLVL